MGLVHSSRHTWNTQLTQPGLGCSTVVQTRLLAVPTLQKHEVKTGKLPCCTTAGLCPAALPLQSMLQGMMHQGMSPRVTPAGMLPRFFKYINGKRQCRNNIRGFQDGDDDVPSQAGTWTKQRCLMHSLPLP